MAIEYMSQDYTTGKQILVFPDHYVGVAKTFARNDSAAATIDGRKIIRQVQFILLMMLQRSGLFLMTSM